MRTLLTLSLIVSALPSDVQAEFVFDDFDTGRGLTTAAIGNIGGGPALPITAMDAVEGGTRTATVTGGDTDWREGGFDNTPGLPFVSLTGNQHSLRNNSGAGTLTLNYDLTSNFDFTDTATEFLQFHLFENVTPGGTWTYSVTVADGGLSETLSGTVVGGSPPAGVLTFQDGDFGAGIAAFASTIDRISITLSGPNGGGLSRTDAGAGAKIVAVPEPSAIALLGLTGIGGVLFARRRRKTEKTEKSV